MDHVDFQTEELLLSKAMMPNRFGHRSSNTSPVPAVRSTPAYIKLGRCGFLQNLPRSDHLSGEPQQIQQIQWNNMTDCTRKYIVSHLKTCRDKPVTVQAPGVA